jgi:hypothetical protein
MMLSLIIIFLFGWLIYAGLCRLVFGKPPEREYYIVREYDVDVIVSRVLEELQELEAAETAEESLGLPDNVILFDQKR